MLLQKKEVGGVTKALYESSNVLASNYNPLTNELEIIFKGGTRYAYKGVRDSDYMRFETADSQGKVLNANIKPKYEVEKLDDIDPTKVVEVIAKVAGENKAKLFIECAERLTLGLDKFKDNYDLKFVLTVRKLAQQTLDAVGYKEPETTA
jgi:HSP20 family molecular chaperone IbpA